MTADVATPGQVSFADRAAKDGADGECIVSCTPVPHTAASAEGGADDARAPFYDQLMSMIHATALENRSTVQDLEIEAAPPAVHHPWRIGRLITCTAGLIVAVAVGDAFVGSALTQWGRPAADGAPDRTVHAVVAAPVDKPAEKTPPAVEPVGLGLTGVKSKQTAESGIEAGTVSAVKPDGGPMESVGPGLKAEKDSRADTPDFRTTARIEVVAPAEGPPDERLAADVPLSAPMIVTGSIGKGPANNRFGRIISDVNMRAGPSNNQPVLATLPRGSAVEVIGCRVWCEVIASGQRGWVYKSFLGTSEVSHER